MSPRDIQLYPEMFLLVTRRVRWDVREASVLVDKGWGCVLLSVVPRSVPREKYEWCLVEKSYCNRMIMVGFAPCVPTATS